MPDISATVDELLERAFARAWDEWDRARAWPAGGVEVPEDSAPVLWFGNRNAYQATQQRVLTLGVNPGPFTFPPGDRWAGVPALAAVAGAERRALAACGQAFDAYPVASLPHHTWFHTWNPLIEPLGASWSGAAGHDTPLHVDLSPIATDSVFSQLDPAFATDLRARGMDILEPLMDALAPRITVASVSSTHFNAMSLRFNVRTVAARVEGNLEARVCAWELPGVLVWVRKTNIAAVSGTLEARRRVGAWAAGVLGGRAGAALGNAVGGPVPEADEEQTLSIHEVVAELQAACPRTANGERAPDFRQPQWREGNAGWRWAQRRVFRAPNGAAAELSPQARPEVVLAFLKDWDAHGREMSQAPWRVTMARSVGHIVFPVGGAWKHYPGLYMRWLE